MSRHRAQIAKCILILSFVLAVGIALPADSANAGHKWRAHSADCCAYASAGRSASCGRCRLRARERASWRIYAPPRGEGWYWNGGSSFYRGSRFYSGPAFYPGWRRW